jgi:hypothetical protein
LSWDLRPLLSAWLRRDGAPSVAWLLPAELEFRAWWAWGLQEAEVLLPGSKLDTTPLGACWVTGKGRPQWGNTAATCAKIPRESRTLKSLPVCGHSRLSLPHMY